MHRYRFPIGDWSNDGHGKCEWFVIEGKKDVDAVREAHFKAKKELGFDIGEMCQHYEQDTLDKKWMERLTALGVDLSEIEKDPLDAKGSEDYVLLPIPHDLVLIWVALLNIIDPELELKVVNNPMPTINFYGYDKKRRHLNTPGYGLFE